MVFSINSSNNIISSLFNQGVFSSSNTNWLNSFISDTEMVKIAIDSGQKPTINLPTFSTTNQLKYSSIDDFLYLLQDEETQIPVNSILTIPVSGMMVRGESWLTRWGLATSTQSIERVIDLSEKNGNVSGLIFQVNSGGGLGYGNYSLSRKIKNTSLTTIAHFDNMASAALESFKSVDYIFANEPDSKIGSYGSYATWMYYTKEGLKENGIGQVTVYAPQSTKKNIEQREAEKGNTKPLEEMLKKSVDQMIRDMRIQRPQLSSDIWEDGRLLTAIEAKEINLVDDILPISEAIEFTQKLIQPNNPLNGLRGLATN